MHKTELSVAMSERLHVSLSKHLIRTDHQEDLIFVLWTPSQGHIRFTALLHTIVYPNKNDRNVHGNASFNLNYFERVCSVATERKCGIAFLHSHPYPGWQGMSQDDIIAEEKMSSVVDALTDLPLVGMTIGSDGIWSARMWEHIQGRQYQRIWCNSVRSAGKSLKVHFNDSLVPKPEYLELFKRTVNVWGTQNHNKLARLNIGIVGLGSVGSIVTETLARMGMTRFTLIDFDVVKRHNLDRQLGATKKDLGRQKIIVAERQIKQSATANRLEINPIPYSVAEKEGYNAALDCDVLFSCVDRPRPRHILNHLAYAHFIPVIDGGIEVRFKNGSFSGVDWQLQTIAPGRPCLECLGAYKPTDVSLEENGLLDDPSYMKNLPENHKLKNNENVFPFSANLASLEVIQLVALATGAGGINDFGVQRYRYWPGIIESETERSCHEGCNRASLEGQGDRYFKLFGTDVGAEKTREKFESVLQPF